MNANIQECARIEEYARLRLAHAKGGLFMYELRKAGKFITFFVVVIFIVSSFCKVFADIEVCTAEGVQDTPNVISDNKGGAIIVWQDKRRDAGDIYAQRVDANGIPRWDLNGVPICTARNAQYYPQVISDGIGGAIIVWEDQRHLGSMPPFSLSTDCNLYAQWVDARGVVRWRRDGIPICTARNAEQAPVIARIDNIAIRPSLIENSMPIPINKFTIIVAWEDSRDEILWEDRDGAEQKIYAQRVDYNGDVKWTGNGIPIRNLGDTDQYMGDIVVSDQKSVIISWNDGDIFAQKIHLDGRLLWGDEGVPVCTERGWQRASKIVSDGSGGAIIAWWDARRDESPPFIFDIYAQRISARGDVMWTREGVPICTDENDQVFVKMLPAYGGGAIIAWEDYRNAGRWYPENLNTDIYTQKIDGGGIVLWERDGLPVCRAVDGQSIVNMVQDNSGRVIFVWKDTRDVRAARERDFSSTSYNSANIYMQKINESGIPQWDIDGMPLFDEFRPIFFWSNAAAYSDSRTFTPVVITAWHDETGVYSDPGRVDINRMDIYAQFVDMDGNRLY